MGTSDRPLISPGGASATRECREESRHSRPKTCATRASENELQGQLHAPRRTEGADLAEDRAGVVGAGESAGVDPVERVEAFPSELRRQLFREFEILDERGIQIEE